jgi:hypothetical protein
MSPVSRQMTLKGLMGVQRIGPGRWSRGAALVGFSLAFSLAFGGWLGAERAAKADVPVVSIDRHPQPDAGGILAPSGVPATYVFTHHGWFHPSCVVRVQSDEVVGADLVVRGQSDGAAR